MYTDFYGLSFNPFDKQMVKEKDAFESEDFREMTARLEYLKEIRGIGVFTASPGMGKTFALRCFAKGLSMPVNSKCAGILQAVMRGFGIRIRVWKKPDVPVDSGETVLSV